MPQRYLKLFLLFLFALTSHGFSQTGIQIFRTNLYVVNANGSTSLYDGDVTLYNDTYNNAVDINDARKMTNFGENIGMLRGTTMLAIEKRQPIVSSDTILFRIWNMQQRLHRIEFIPFEMAQPGLAGTLQDSYLNTNTPVSLTDTTRVNFTIDGNAGSYAQDRFRIVFNVVKAIPVTFTSVIALQQNSNINVEWKVDNEKNIKLYEVERSPNDQGYTKVSDMNVNNNIIGLPYQFTDKDPLTGYNYYRIKSIDMYGKVSYSNSVSVNRGMMKQVISIYPNPVTGGLINLQLTNQPKGVYLVRLLNNFGQVVLTKKADHAEGSSTEVLQTGNLQKGNYFLEITKPDNTRVTLKVAN